MKRILVIALILLIALFMLYCASLDGVIHIKAFAAQDCEFCKFVEEHDLQADVASFPQNMIGSMKSISYELVLNEKLSFGHDRAARRPLQYNIPFNYCPECGRRVR